MTEGMITCLSCGHQIEAHYLYCPHCKSRADAPAGHQTMAPIPKTSLSTGGYYDTQTLVTCTGCGRHVENHYAHCPYCHVDLSLAVAPSRERLTPDLSAGPLARGSARGDLRGSLSSLRDQIPPELAASIKPLVMQAVSRKLLKPKTLLMLAGAVIAGVMGLVMLIILLLVF